MKKTDKSLWQKKIIQKKLYPPPLTSSGVGTLSPSLSHGLCRDPSHGGGPVPDCVLGSNPHVGRDCETCAVGSFLWSGCGLVPLNALAWQRHRHHWSVFQGFKGLKNCSCTTFVVVGLCLFSIASMSQQMATSLHMIEVLPGSGTVALWLNAVETVLQGADEDLAAVVCWHFGLFDQTDGCHQGLYSAAIVS